MGGPAGNPGGGRCAPDAQAGGERRAALPAGERGPAPSTPGRRPWLAELQRSTRGLRGVEASGGARTRAARASAVSPAGGMRAPWPNRQTGVRSPIWRPSCCASTSLASRTRWSRSASLVAGAARRQPPRTEGPQSRPSRRRRAGDAGGVPPPSARWMRRARRSSERVRWAGGSSGREVRRAVTRALRRRIAELDTSAFENLCARC